VRTHQSCSRPHHRTRPYGIRPGSPSFVSPRLRVNNPALIRFDLLGSTLIGCRSPCPPCPVSRFPNPKRISTTDPASCPLHLASLFQLSKNTPPACRSRCATPPSQGCQTAKLADCPILDIHGLPSSTARVPDYLEKINLNPWRRNPGTGLSASVRDAKLAGMETRRTFVFSHDPL
jgi:hypothetical protein